MSKDTANIKMNFGVSKGIALCKKDTDYSFVLTEDKSLLYTKPGGDFSVYLGNDWRYEIIVDSATGLCIKFQCFLDELHVIPQSLCFPHATRDCVFFSKEKPLLSGDGCHYTPYDTTVFWDQSTKILCIGNPSQKGAAIEFTDNIVMLLRDGQLLCLYLSLDNLKVGECFVA